MHALSKDLRPRPLFFLFGLRIRSISDPWSPFGSFPLQCTYFTFSNYVYVYPPVFPCFSFIRFSSTPYIVLSAFGSTAYFLCAKNLLVFLLWNPVHRRLESTAPEIREGRLTWWVFMITDAKMRPSGPIMWWIILKPWPMFTALIHRMRLSLAIKG